MTLNDKDFYTIWGEALASTNKELFAAEWSTSSVFPEDADLLDIAAYVDRLWNVAHMSIQDIRSAAGLTQAKMATRFCIPRRTIEDWCTGTRVPPDYLRLLMAEALGIIKR